MARIISGKWRIVLTKYQCSFEIIAKLTALAV